MTREIKFRIWDKKKEKMSRPFELLDAAYEGFPRPITDDNGEFDIHAEVEIMQSTGLKDKEGKEIYEGDLVMFNSGRYVYPVVFENGAFCIGNKGKSKNKVGNFNNTEIIGNIYENSYLLTTHPPNEKE